jgi:signal transduction histidine kinase
MRDGLYLSPGHSPILSVRRALALAIGIVLAHRLLMILTESNPVLRSGLNDGIIFVLSLGAAVGLFYVAYRSRDGRRIRIAWMLLGTGVSLVTIGAAIFAILDIPGFGGAFPSIADGFFLAFYPLFGAGLILMSWSSLSKQELIKTLMDIAIVMLAALLVFWIILIAPILAAEKNAEPLIVAIGVAYPICDWAMIFAILRVLYSGPGYVRPIPLLLLAFATISQIIADGVFLSESLKRTYVPGDWVDSLYVANFSLLILMIVLQLAPRPKESTNHISAASAARPQFGWAVYIPNLWAAAAYLLLTWAHNNELPISFEMLAWIVGGILGLVIVRQIIINQENARLDRQLQAELAERKSAEQSVRKLNEELESRVQERTAALTQEITERKQAEAEREKLIAELGAKNDELERFTHTVSHDLKSPLITIRGFLGFLEKEALAGDIERVKADVAHITEATDKMQRLLNELLELSRIGRKMNQPVNIPFNSIVQEAVNLVHGQLTHRGVVVKIAENMPTVNGDRMRLVQVVQNLVDNAVKFMGGQTNPLIEISQRGEDDGKPIFFVKDNGMGIPPEHHERIFGLFNQLNPKMEGTGVGLALVKRIVEFHGGRIWVESEAGKGSTFYFTLGKGDPKS